MLKQEKIKTGIILGDLNIFITFAAGWTPCIGPILGAVVTLGLSTGQMLIIQKVNLTKKEGKELGNSHFSQKEKSLKRFFCSRLFF
ncbi:cytochrome c biogenesis protein CcdA [Peribacillus frigoritolerans]|uniref:cytochrome c biogenesis protein CcdA n=1 Tax=Peribacillus frigoritolerans TaxID=450367 RepID=UPI0030080CEA